MNFSKCSLFPSLVVFNPQLKCLQELRGPTHSEPIGNLSLFKNQWCSVGLHVGKHSHPPLPLFKQIGCYSHMALVLSPVGLSLKGLIVTREISFRKQKQKQNKTKTKKQSMMKNELFRSSWVSERAQALPEGKCQCRRSSIGNHTDRTQSQLGSVSYVIQDKFLL